MAGGARRVVGVDGSPALLARARRRIADHPILRDAHAAGRIELELGDVRVVRRSDRFALVVLAGVLSHLDGPEDALRALVVARRALEPDGTVLIDQLGPGGMPPHDLPLSVDWERDHDGLRVIRRSELGRREVPEGLRVRYRTVTDVVGPDGTISRLPASFRLWYPSAATLLALADEAELDVAGMYGSHDLEPFDDSSDRCIVVARGRGA